MSQLVMHQNRDPDLGSLNIILKLSHNLVLCLRVNSSNMASTATAPVLHSDEGVCVSCHQDHQDVEANEMAKIPNPLLEVDQNGWKPLLHQTLCQGTHQKFLAMTKGMDSSKESSLIRKCRRNPVE